MSVSAAALRARAALDDIDFDPLQVDTGASPDLLEDFKRFLALKAAHQDFFAALLSPSPSIDTLWHNMILDTLAYKEACEAMLGAGGFIHHNPRGAQDAAARSARLRRTASYYRAAFGSDPLSGWPTTGAARAAPAAEPQAASRRRSATELADGEGRQAQRRRIGAPGSAVTIRALTGQILTFVVDLSDSVESLKARIAASPEGGVPPYDQRLIFNGTQLQDGRALSDFGIQAGSTLHMLHRLRGC